MNDRFNDALFLKQKQLSLKPQESLTWQELWILSLPTTYKKFNHKTAIKLEKSINNTYALANNHSDEFVVTFMKWAFFSNLILVITLTLI